MKSGCSWISFEDRFGFRRLRARDLIFDIEYSVSRSGAIARQPVE